MNNTMQYATVVKALNQATQLALIASDWNLDEVEIDGEIIDTYSLVGVFKNALTALQELGLEVIDKNKGQENPGPC